MSYDAIEDAFNYISEGQPGDRKGQDQVEGLPDGIESHWLAPLHLLGELLEVGLEPNGNEGQAEEPAPQRIGHRLDDPRLDQLHAIPPQHPSEQGREDEGEG